MAMISLVCLLALSSVALAHPYGGYGGQTMPTPNIRRPVIQTFPPQVSSYGQVKVFPSRPRSNDYESSYNPEIRTIVPAPMPLPPTRADLICRGRLPETVIVMEDKRGIFACLEDGKGEEILCQPGLWYHEVSRRCERTLGPIPNACDSQPCLNGGQCFQDGSHYQCQCAPGFDGPTCELDARVCQQQQPCGSAFGTRCQSFRFGAALSYVCIHQHGAAYGFSASQVIPSPCTGIDGALALSATDKAVAYCDGDRLSIESCVESTHWDDSKKACMWDVEIAPGTDLLPGTKTFIPSGSSYGEVLPTPPPKMIDNYGERLPTPPPKMIDNYGERLPAPLPKTIDNYGERLPTPLPKTIDNYGERLPTPPPKMIDNYGERLPAPLPKTFDNYGERLPTPPPPRKFVDSYATLPPPPRVNNYGTVLPPPPRVNNYGTLLPPPPKVSPPSGY